MNTRNDRKPTYNIELYRRMRSAVERFFGWLKSFRRMIIIRYEKLASTYKALSSINNHPPKIRNFEMSSYCI